MLERLGELYLPFIGWTLVGLLLLRKLPTNFPKVLAQGLYWVGVPLQVLAFTLRADFTGLLGWVPIIVTLSLVVAWLVSWSLLRWLPPEQHGTFLLASTIGNTGFVGLAITPYLLEEKYLAWVVIYSLVHNVIGSYGLGVAIASCYGSKNQVKNLGEHLKAILLTPAIWAFGVGWVWKASHWNMAGQMDIEFLADLVPPVALVLVGIRLQLKDAENIRTSLLASVLAAVIKVVALPAVVGMALHFSGLPKDAVLGMVLQAGMPTAVAGVILAETYGVTGSQVVALAIAFSSIGVLFTIPLWLWLFG